MKTFKEFINESIKYLSVPELSNWLESRSGHTFIALDTETTGLRGPKQDQLTQIAAVAYEFDWLTKTFNKIGEFNEKIKLTDPIKREMGLPDSKIKGALKFNRYGVPGGKYSEEQEVIQSLLKFVGSYPNVVLLIQNAPFDMPMINVRSKFGRLTSEIFDTKDFYAYFLIPTLQGLAETDPEAQAILDQMGKSFSGKLWSSSLPKVAQSLGVESSAAHDALFDCEYMVKTLEKAIQIVFDNPQIMRTEYIKPRISTDRWIKMKNKEQGR